MRGMAERKKDVAGLRGRKEKHKFWRQKVKKRFELRSQKLFDEICMNKGNFLLQAPQIYLNSFLIRYIPRKKINCGLECWFRRKCKQSLNPSRYFYFAFLIFQFMTSWDSDAGIYLNYCWELSARWATEEDPFTQARTLMKPQKVWIITEAPWDYVYDFNALRFSGETWCVRKVPL